MQTCVKANLASKNQLVVSMNAHHQESESDKSGFPFLLGSSSVPVCCNEIDCFLVDINVDISFSSVHLNY